MDTSPVQIIYKPLVKKQRKNDNDSKTVHNILPKTAVIKVNTKNYYFNMNYVLYLEPETNLFNPYCNKYNKNFNTKDEILEYITDIPNFNIICDYFKGYSLDILLNFINNNHTINELLNHISKLKMINLYEKISSYYPIIYIENIIFTINIKKLNELEPNNKLFEKSVKIDNCNYISRDINIFKNIIYPYINGVNTRYKTIKMIDELKTSDFIMYKKLYEDLKFFRFDKLLQYVFEE